MKYKTSDLSKILNVSDNTIRRYAQKGYLNPERDEDTKYRYFNNSDVEKMAYISKYRKIGFGHEEIANMFQYDIDQCNVTFEEKMEEIDREIKKLTYLRHMLKDDINMMNRIGEYKDNFIEKDCVEMKYVSYKTYKKIKLSHEYVEQVHRFLYDFPEIRYIYIVRKHDVLNRNLWCEEAIAIRTALAEYLELDMSNEVIESYPKHFSIMRIVRLPIDFMNEGSEESEIAKNLIFDEFMNYMKINGYKLAGDIVGIKIGFSKENEKEMQYVLFSMPVQKIDD